MIDTLATSPVLFLTAIAVLGLLVGSFLNVVILRLPKMMDRQWRMQCAELLESPKPVESPAFNLITPASACPQCGHKIRPWENIPVISYLLLKGRCSGCTSKISLRYPLIEAFTALFSLAVAWHFGFSLMTAGALVLTWALIALSTIDIDHQLLPDSITLPLLWLGLLLNVAGLYTDIQSSILGAVAGYLVLWIVYWAFKLLTGKEGMGYGDFKLLAMLGAWMGWQAIPAIILLSSLVGAIVGIAMIVLRGRDKNIPIPFGPYLAAAGWINLLWGDHLIRSYLNWSGLSN